MNLQEYRNKVLGCWNGKNIGGTLGAPFECERGIVDLTYYTQELNGNPLPNDDLDLQLVWLCAAEKYGPALTAKHLADYWLDYIVPNWSEYGIGKANLRTGLVPPLSGGFHNVYKDSNGAWILTELWACLNPGDPESAAKYAAADSSVNHADEGVWSAVFIAAIEAAAFVESDRDRLIDIGLSYLPEDCATAGAVRLVRKLKEKEPDWKKAFAALLEKYPSSFGSAHLAVARPEDGIIGFDAPSNVGIVILGWLYGDGDFEKSICIAAGCMEDADCTAGTLAAILGIILGQNRLPEKWLAPLGGKIVTSCVPDTDISAIKIPKTTEELTDRVVALMPRFALKNNPKRFAVKDFDLSPDAERLTYAPERVTAWFYSDAKTEWGDCKTVSEHGCSFNAYVTAERMPTLLPGQSLDVTLTLENNTYQQWIDVEILPPKGITVSPATRLSVSLQRFHCDIGRSVRTFTVTADESFTDFGKLRFILSARDRVTELLVSMPLIPDSQ